MRDHSRSYSRSSQRSLSSDGVVDDDDEEPFSAAVSVPQQPRQDTLPRRPSPGGRFPSDLQVNAQRGLQVPLSPASASSGYDNFDRDVVASSGALPASGRGSQTFRGARTTRLVTVARPDPHGGGAFARGNCWPRGHGRWCQSVHERAAGAQLGRLRQISSGRAEWQPGSWPGNRSQHAPMAAHASSDWIRR